MLGNRANYLFIKLILKHTDQLNSSSDNSGRTAIVLTVLLSSSHRYITVSLYAAIGCCLVDQAIWRGSLASLRDSVELLPPRGPLHRWLTSRPSRLNARSPYKACTDPTFSSLACPVLAVLIPFFIP